MKQMWHPWQVAKPRFFVPTAIGIAAMAMIVQVVPDLRQLDVFQSRAAVLRRASLQQYQDSHHTSDDGNGSHVSHVADHSD